MIESIVHHLVSQGMNPDLMQRLAGSLLHFVWQGASIAMVSAVILRLLSNRSAEWRYTVSVGALFLMLAAPVVTFIFYNQTGRITLMILQFISDTMQSSVQSAAQAATTKSWTEWIVLVWFTGVLGCSIRLIAGWRMAVSLTKVGTSAAPSNIQNTFHAIMARLAMTRPVRLLVSLRIDTPVAVGWLRPAILLPVTALTGLTEAQLRAVLSHELAHIRRHDFLVNLVQRGVESILFYHPAVWWISARIRAEREHCCDDLAVQISGDPSTYAEALIELERVRTTDPEPAVAATGGMLARRIHRLLGYRIDNSDLQSAIAALTFVVVWIIVGAWQSDNTLKAKSTTPLPVPSQIVTNSAHTSPADVTKNAIAAIVTAQPVQSPPASSTVAVGNEAVEGILRDDFGMPAVGFQVVASVVRGDTDSSLVENIYATTDNNGRYRLNAVPPGRYYISTTGRPNFTTYYPGTLDKERSSIVTVAPGTATTNVNFALDPLSQKLMTSGLDSLIPSTSIRGGLANSAANGTLMLFVSVQIEGGGPTPIFANGRFPRLRLTKLGTNNQYEMPFSNVVINVPVNFNYGVVPDEYRVSVEDLPEGYAVKNIMYRADEAGLRFVDVSTQPLRISSRAIDARSGASTQTVAAPDLPIAITLTRKASPAPSGFRISGTSDGTFVMPKIPLPGGKVPSVVHPDVGVYISGKPGTLYDNGTFEFAGVSPGLHSIILLSNMGGTGAQRMAAAEVMVRDRNIEGVSLQSIQFLPKNFSSPQTLPLTAAGASVLPFSSLSVRALDAASQQPIDSAYATFSGLGAPIVFFPGSTSPVIKIPNLLPGEYLLTTEAYGYKSKTQTVTVGFGETLTDIAITRAPK